MIEFHIDKPKKVDSDEKIKFWLDVDNEGDLILVAIALDANGRPFGRASSILGISHKTGCLDRHLYTDRADFGVPHLALERTKSGEGGVVIKLDE